MDNEDFDATQAEIEIAYLERELHRAELEIKRLEKKLADAAEALS